MKRKGILGIGLLLFASLGARAQEEPALAVLKSEAKLSSVPISVALPNIETGKMQALAIASGRRFAGASAIPTGAEAGLPGFEAEQWLAMVAPMGLSDAIADKLHRDIVDVLHTPEFAAILRVQGAETAPSTPAELAAFIASETARLKTLIDSIGMRME